MGLIRAMCEAGIPIDMVCGTSIGALIGALWAEERNLTTFTQRGREWAMVSCQHRRGGRVGIVTVINVTVSLVSLPLMSLSPVSLSVTAISSHSGSDTDSHVTVQVV